MEKCGVGETGGAFMGEGAVQQASGHALCTLRTVGKAQNAYCQTAFRRPDQARREEHGLIVWVRDHQEE
jgi:hypothetical protein